MSSPPLKLDTFTGLVPRVPATRLPANAALVAENIDFGYGELVSLKGPFKLFDLAVPALSAYSEDGLRFYAWPEDVDAVASPYQNGEAHDRLYYTTNDDFRVTPLSLATQGGAPPDASYRVGVPRPTRAPAITVVHPTPPVAPIATVDPQPSDTYATRLTAAQAALNASTAADTKTTTETRAYAYTYSNIYNEEGPPSPAAVVEVKALTTNGVTTYSTVQVQVFFDGSGEYVPITTARVYRTSRGGAGDDYFFTRTASGSSGAVTVTDNTSAQSLNEVLASLNAYPPDPRLKGLMNLGNGILAAWNGRVMYFSEAYKPWSWPPSYAVTFGHTIVGAVAHGAGALVTTVGEPALLSGVSPDAMSQTPLQGQQAGVSKWAMLSVPGSVLYASADGIVEVQGGTPSLEFSKRHFTRAVWRARCGAGLSSMQFAFYDGNLIVFSKANKFVPFMLQLSEGQGGMTDLPGLVARTAVVLTTSDQMYTVNGTALNQFGGGADLPLRWRSGDIVLPAPTMLAAAEVECTGEFTIRFYQAGVLGYTRTVVAGKSTFRLPDRAIPGHTGLKASDRWQFEIEGSGRFKWLKAGPTIRSLNEV